MATVHLQGALGTWKAPLQRPWFHSQPWGFTSSDVKEVCLMCWSRTSLVRSAALIWSGQCCLLGRAEGQGSGEQGLGLTSASHSCDSCHSPHCDKADDETSLESILVNVSATEELLILHPHYLLPLWSPVPPPLTSHVKDMDSQCGKAMDQAMSWCPTATTKLCSCTRQLLLLSFYLRSTCQEGDRNFVVFYLIPETSLHPDV